MEATTQHIYDLPLRILHWSFALSYIIAFAIGKIIDDDSPLFSYHAIFGIILLTTIGIRFIWGFLGSKNSHFSGFHLNPKSLKEYLSNLLQNSEDQYIVHNPASSWAAILLYALAILTGSSGYAMTLGIAGEAMEEIHELAANLMFLISVFHISGVLFHQRKYTDQIQTSMLTGNRILKTNEYSIKNSQKKIGIGIVVFLLATLSHLIYHYQASGYIDIVFTKFKVEEHEHNEEDHHESHHESHNDNHDDGD